MKTLAVVVTLIGVAAAPMLAGGGKGTGTGVYAEARTAEVFAGGCIMNSEAGTAGRQAVLAWKVGRGSYNGVTLDDLAVVAAVAGNQNLGLQEIGGGRASTQSAVYVDQRATPAQQLALVAMANDLSRGVVSTVVEIVPTAIQFTEDSEAVRVSAGQVALSVNKHFDHDVSCGAMQWFHPLSSTSTATIGYADQHKFTGSALGTRWSDPNKKSAFFGTFSY